MAIKVKGLCENPAEFPKRLIAIREFRNLKQSDVAKKLGIATVVYASWEKGLHLPRKYTELAKALQVPLEALTVDSSRFGKSTIEYTESLLNSQKLAFLKSSQLQVKSNLNEVISNAIKTDFNLMQSFQEAYDQHRVFLFEVENNEMARIEGNSLNKGMTAVIVNEPNIRILEHKIVLIATGNEKAKLRELSFDGLDLILTSYNSNLKTERIILSETPCNIFGYVALAFTTL